MAIVSLILLVLALICLFCYQKSQLPWLRSIYISFLTTFYHIFMRFLVGEIVVIIFKNRSFNENSFIFRIHSYEPKLYKILKVKKWKTGVITAVPEQFDINKVGPKGLLHNMLQAELVHRIIMVLSFVPLLLIIPYGSPIIFILTSIIACFIDTTFVIIQRFNRPRIINLIKYYDSKNKSR